MFEANDWGEGRMHLKITAPVQPVQMIIAMGAAFAAAVGGAAADGRVAIGENRVARQRRSEGS